MVNTSSSCRQTDDREYIPERIGLSSEAAEPVEGHGAAGEIGAGLQLVGGALEGVGTIGAVGAAITGKRQKPEEKIQQVEREYQERQLLPQMHGLVAHIPLLQRRPFVENKGEERDGTIVTEGEMTGVYQQWLHLFTNVKGQRQRR